MTDRAAPVPRVTKRYAAKRQMILDAAVGHFNARGVRGTALTDVAASVGLVTNSITYYYRRKEDLAAACYLRSLDWHGALLDEAARAEDPAARLRVFLASYFRGLAAIETGAERPQVRLAELMALPSPQSEAVFAAYNGLFRRARGLFVPESVDLGRPERNARTHLVLSVVHTVRLWIDRYEPQDYGRVAERVADILLGGLAGPGSRWPETEPPLAAAGEGPTEPFLRAATALINEEGYRGASVEKISARLSVTKGSFYHHNDNKDDLVASCFERTFDVLRAEQAAAEARGGPGWDRLTACARALIRHQFEAGGPLLRCAAVGALPEGLRAEVPARLRRLWERLAFPICDGVADGSIRPVDPTIAAQVVSSVIDAASDLRRWCPAAEAENAADLFARPLFLGLLTEG
ncbi:TetR/AcrR family transcriptional regulator [Methylobacterium radiodurans]|uniref:TetR/AcrR family transcriptional regulator n=1 Tax=Methylobacterium radiodurans TaxID=2202828 RepID=A0A2U8VSD9_9HYPH|nr:TetR/AcrR family transcriptional regulator [Methylobacterium radiodurans]AWN36310.1 TetR/AcrR family transcriptional regulator [Methylobacterium radiodurans]